MRQQDTAPLTLEYHLTDATFVSRGKETLISEWLQMCSTVQLGKKQREHWITAEEHLEAKYQDKWKSNIFLKISFVYCPHKILDNEKQQ